MPLFATGKFTFWHTSHFAFAVSLECTSFPHLSRMEKYHELREYKNQHGNCDVATKYSPNPALGRWVSTQRSEYKKFRDGTSKHMTQEKINKLNRLGFKWEMLPNRSNSSSDEE